ncbi:MAG TPA: hypothetical protein VHT75_01060 [Acidimicrobiales bacterium]|nr:hypothetical protein [Acidimicrobiales bacterium]
MAAGALIVLLLLSACQATIRVGVTVNSNGSGSVTVRAHLDRDAAASYASSVRTSDLTQAGWAVTGPTTGAGGSVDFTATKAFANPAAAKAVAAELSGPTGPFRDLTIVRRASFFQTSTRFQGTVDLTCGINCFSDPQLQQTLGGAGIDPAALQTRTGVALDQVFQFQVAARLPGQIQAANGSRSGGEVVWPVHLGQTATLSAQARTWNVTHILLTLLVGVLAVVALVLSGRRRARHRAARRGAHHRR